MLNIFQQAEHAMLPKMTAEERSRQEFVKSFKQHIQSNFVPAVTSAYFNRAVPAYVEEKGKEPSDYREARSAFEDDPLFQFYLSSQRVSQELMWFGVNESITRQLDDMNDQAEKLPATGGTLEVDPDFDVPKYVSSLDIHCMPGGYVGKEDSDALHAGALYDRGVYLYAMGYMGPNNDDMGRSVCNYIKRKLSDFKPTKILDIGCTVGHSTLPYAEMFPDAEVTAIDVAGSCVTYAHHRAEAMGLPVHFKQRNAEATGFEDESFDLVVSHILLHETSKKAMPKIFNECHRILKPGGLMIHADLPPFENMDVYTQLILDNETWYNNEPFWSAMREMDQIKLATDAGFAKENVYFDTAGMAIMEMARQADMDVTDAVEELEDREFTAGEYAPGGGWEVLIGKK